MYAFIVFFIAIGVVLIVSRRNIGLSLFLGALILGIFTPIISTLVGSSFPYDLSLSEGSLEILKAFFNPAVILLALSVALIPLIGGTMERSGQMDTLVNNLRLPRRATISSLPAILGMLPMPGGALLSAPLVERTGDGVSASDKAAINVWFRHILFLVYPLATALLVTAKIVDLSVYTLIPRLFPFFILSLLTGYVFLLREVDGNVNYEGEFSLKGLILPLLVVLIAPVIDLILGTIFPPVDPFSELALFIGVVSSLSLSSVIGGIAWRDIVGIFKKMKSWNFAFVIFGMFAFLNVFGASPIPERINSVQLQLQLLFVVVGFFLGLGTGRIQAPMGILLPIVLLSYEVTPMAFSIMYFSVFIGYALSPVHPCVSVSIEYFDTSLGKFFRSLAAPAMISLFGVFIVSFLSL